MRSWPGLVGATILGTCVTHGAHAQGFTRARLTLVPGTVDCGGPALSPAPAPPFVGALHGDTGCAAPTSDTTGLARCQAATTRAFARFAADMIECEVAQARAVFRHGSSSGIAGDAARCKFADVASSARTRLEAALDRLGCPAAVRTGAAAHESALLAGALSFDAMNGDVYCDEGADAASIDPAGVVTGAVPVPANAKGRAVVACERGVWRNVARLIRRLGECRVAAASALAAGGASDEVACRSAALARYDVVGAALGARGTCPACLDGAAQAALRDRVVARDRRSNGLIYACSFGGPPLSQTVLLGVGCLQLPFGAGAPIPDGATKTVAITSVTGSTASFAGTDAPSRLECTLGSGPAKHCLTGNGACATDTDCGGRPGACAYDVNCFFIQPIAVANGALSLCIVDVVETEETGTIDLTSGAIRIVEHHASRVYLTGNAASPCPRCVAGACAGGQSPGAECTAVGLDRTAIECLPGDAGFITALQLHELFGTGPAEANDFGTGFCPGQATQGAFGRPDAVRITAAGSPAGDLGDGLPHDVVLATVFCIPSTGIDLVDSVVRVPGPGMASGAAVVQLE